MRICRKASLDARMPRMRLYSFECNCAADVDCSGIVDGTDANIVQECIMGSEYCTPRADVNEDGTIDVADATLVLSVSSGFASMEGCQVQRRRKMTAAADSPAGSRRVATSTSATSLGGCTAVTVGSLLWTDGSWTPAGGAEQTATTGTVVSEPGVFCPFGTATLRCEPTAVNLDFATHDGSECNLASKNLGGTGPVFTDPEELRYAAVGRVNGADFDLVIRNTTEYLGKKTRPSGCNGVFGLINVAKGSVVDMDFAFEDSLTQQPITVPEFFFSFFDLDEQKNSAKKGGKEKIHLSGYTSFALDDQTLVSAVDQSYWTCSAAPAATCAGPDELCYYDATCSDPASGQYHGGLGCNAGGVNWNCRFCGFSSAGGVAYPECPTSSSYHAEQDYVKAGTFESTYEGVEEDNPTSPDALNDLQRQLSVTFRFDQTSSFNVRFEISGDLQTKGGDGHATMSDTRLPMYCARSATQ